MKIKAVIVDDEAHALKLFRQVSALFPNNLDIIGEAMLFPSAVELIKKEKPQVVFMDIELPRYSGMQLVDFFEVPNEFLLIYVTAHSEYAIEAIKTNAFDYLLKPLELEDLKRCILRIEKHLGKEQTKKSKELLSPETGQLKLNIQSKQGITYINFSDILFIEASAMYCILHTKQGQKVVSKPLSEFDYLEQYSFFRVHRSYLVNTRYVDRIIYESGAQVALLDSSILPIARARKASFLDYLAHK